MSEIAELIERAQRYLRAALQAESPGAIEDLVERADECMRRAEALSHEAPPAIRSNGAAV